MTQDAGPAAPAIPEPDDRNEWLELFFDLVVVAAVAVLTEGLRTDATGLGLGLFLVLFTGVWLSWVTVALYTNVAGQLTRTRVVVIAMALIAVMAATSPLHHDSRANAFAGGFLILRFVTARASLQTGRLLTSWPLLQLGGASLPWIVAMWVPSPWKYGLWGLGLLIDLGFVAGGRGAIDDNDIERYKQRMAEQRHHEMRRIERQNARIIERAGAIIKEHPEYADEMEANLAAWQPETPKTPESVAVVDVATDHLSDRLGTFVIIVLGEVASALVLRASATDWTNEFIRTVAVAFTLLVGLWWLTFSYGFVGAPESQLATLPPRFGLPMHLLTTMGIVGLAAGIGHMVAEPDAPLLGVLRWTMCAGLALHYLVMGIAGITGSATRTWLFGWIMPCIGVVLAVGALPDLVTNLWALVLFVGTVGWLACYRWVGRRNPRRTGSRRRNRRRGGRRRR